MLYIDQQSIGKTLGNADVLPEDLAYAGAYDTGGGEVSKGEIGYTRPPARARHVWLDFYATTDDHHRAWRLTITTGPAG